MDKKINQLVGELLSLAVFLTINSTMEIFVDFRAHTQLLDIDIYQEGWEKGVVATERFEIDLKDTAAKKELTKAKKILKEHIDKKIFGIGGIKRNE